MREIKFRAWDDLLYFKETILKKVVYFKTTK
jgi:hypothetical protein